MEKYSGDNNHLHEAKLIIYIILKRKKTDLSQKNSSLFMRFMLVLPPQYFTYLCNNDMKY